MNPLSHEYRFQPRDVLAALAPAVAGLLLVAVLTRAVQWAGWLPAPVPADMDRVILAEKARMSAQASDAGIVLLGDSSCLMDVSAPELARRLNRQVLNLATISYVGLDEHAELLRRFTAANPGRLKTVVLLLHPEALRRSQPSPDHVRFLRAATRQDAERGVWSAESRDEDASRRFLRAVDFWAPLRDSLLNRLPSPLPRAFGPRYGFPDDLRAVLASNQGSLEDPNQLDADGLRGNPDYRLAAALEESAARFRSAVPDGVMLLVGVTPVPETFAARDHAATVREMSGTLAGWLNAGGVLDLPPVLADADFATLTHLNAAGAARFSGLLADRLTSE